MITAVGISGCEQEDGAMQSMFSEEHHEMGKVHQVENLGLSPEEAEQFVFQYQLEKIAIADRAQEAGLEVTEAEAVELSEELRESLESGEGENAEEALESERELMEQLDLSEDEYWQEYRTHNSKMELYRQKLVEYKNEQQESGPWNEEREEIVEDFQEEEAENIEEFKESLGISS